MPEWLNVCINYQFILLDRVRTVAEAGGVRDRGRRTKGMTIPGDDNKVHPFGVKPNTKTIIISHDYA